jgi:hypothetical protein
MKQQKRCFINNHFKLSHEVRSKLTVIITGYTEDGSFISPRTSHLHLSRQPRRLLPPCDTVFILLPLHRLASTAAPTTAPSSPKLPCADWVTGAMCWHGEVAHAGASGAAPQGDPVRAAGTRGRMPSSPPRVRVATLRQSV